MVRFGEGVVALDLAAGGAGERAGDGEDPGRAEQQGAGRQQEDLSEGHFVARFRGSAVTSTSS